MYQKLDEGKEVIKQSFKKEQKESIPENGCIGQGTIEINFYVLKVRSASMFMRILIIVLSYVGTYRGGHGKLDLPKIIRQV